MSIKINMIFFIKISNKIWQHSWLPIKHLTWVPSHEVAGLGEANVELLINADQRTWNTELIDGLFAPHEAEMIKAIPLARISGEDTLYWSWTQSGKYSCKSGYWFLKHEIGRGEEVESITGERSFWRRVWSLRIPPKTRNFIWRAWHDSILTKENLLRCYVSDNALCDRCSCNMESTLHALWTCPELSSIWSSEEWSFRPNTSFMLFKELLSWVLWNHDNPKLFAMTVWGIWHQRNQVRLRIPCWNTDQVAPQAKEKLAEYKAAIPPILPRMPRQKEVWKPPPDPILFKINFDGAVFTEERKSGIGVVTHDHQG